MRATRKTLTHTKSGHPIMPFGKHQGKPFPCIPKRYLVWLAHNVTANGEYKAVRFAAWDELRRRRWRQGRHLTVAGLEKTP